MIKNQSYQKSFKFSQLTPEAQNVALGYDFSKHKDFYIEHNISLEEIWGDLMEQDEDLFYTEEGIPIPKTNLPHLNIR